MTGRIRRPLPLRGPYGPWEGVRDELTRAGTVLVYGEMPAWLPREGTEDELRLVLGRDWHRYQNFTQPRMRERFAASRLLLRHTAAAILRTAPHLVDLSYQPGGRPYVRGCDQIDVSLSHTEEMMVVGITRTGRVGVDVERADRRLAHTGSESQACTPYEKARLDAGGEARRNDTMVRLWTLKEAYSKALGQGLRFRFTEFGFALDGEDTWLVRPDGTRASGSEWTFGTFPVGDRYVVSAAVFDTGFGEPADVAVDTMLDEGLFDALLGAPGPASGNPAGFLGEPDGVDAVAGAQFGDDRREVVADGSLGQVQTSGDLGGVGTASGEA